MTDDRYTLGNRITVARSLAEEAHKGQKRKFTKRPYFLHCEEVANHVAAVTFKDPEKFPRQDVMVAAAYLHDAVEDTTLSIADIGYQCGDDVAILVYWLTDPTDCPYSAVIERYQNHAPREAVLIKQADILSNLFSPWPRGREEQKHKYFNNKADLLGATWEKGDQGLYFRSKDILDRHFAETPYSGACSLYRG